MESLKGRTIWLTGLSGAGKSTIGLLLKERLEAESLSVILLDGDVLRSGLNRDLGFSATDRTENIRRAGEVARILCDAGHVVIAAFITPLECLREALRNLFGRDRYIEVFLDSPLEVCERRDPKGLYKKARRGEIPSFTGISSAFERPARPDMVVRTDVLSVDQSLQAVLGHLADCCERTGKMLQPRPGTSFRDDQQDPQLFGVIGDEGLVEGPSCKKVLLPESHLHREVVTVRHESQPPGTTYGERSDGEMDRPLRGRPGVEPSQTRPERLRKVAVIGLDGAPPSLVFGDAAQALPNLKAIMEHGVWGALRSTDPPITIPAWTSITTGLDPGELGLYGFRNRLDHSYSELTTVNAAHVRAERVWDRVEAAGGSSVLVGIPQTWPARPHRGITIAGFPVPDTDGSTAYPQSLEPDLHLLAGGPYMPDVKDFRTADRDSVLKSIRTMADRRFRLAGALIAGEDWDFFMMVEMATDRMHHCFWRSLCADGDGPAAAKNGSRIIPEFYEHLDSLVGSLMARLDDSTTLLVVSDHGAREMTGGICINEWLISRGLLVLKSDPNRETRLIPDMVDWPRTKAWAEGGYYGRVFLNVKHREPHGTIGPDDYEAFRANLARMLMDIPDPQGRPMPNLVLKPESLYRQCTGVAPDLMVYFDGLSRRSLGMVGTGEVYSSANDSGADEANHDPDGIFLAARMDDLRNGRRNGRQITAASVLDVTPTILAEMGIQIPEGLSGNALDLSSGLPVRTRDSSEQAHIRTRPAERGAEDERGFTSEEEEIVRQRLMDLGYI